MWPVGMPDARAGRRAQPDRARPACRRTTSSPCCSSTCARSAARACASAPRSWASSTLPEGVEVVLRDVARRRPSHASAPVTSSPPTARTAGSGRRSASPCAGPTGSAHAVTAIFRAPLWQVVGDAPLRHLRRRPTRRAPGSSCPPAAATAGCYGTWVDPHDVEAYTPRAVRAAHPRRRRRRRPRGLDRAHRRLQLRRPTGRPLPRRQRLPRRRCRPPRDPARRHRDEHRDPRRARPGLEARLGAARLGRTGAARHATRPSGGRSPPTTSPDPPTPTARPARSPTSCTSTSAGASRTSGSTPAEGACPHWTCSAPDSRSSPDPTQPHGRRRRSGGRRSPSASSTRSARGRSASAARRAARAPRRHPRAAVDARGGGRRLTCASGRWGWSRRTSPQRGGDASCAGQRGTRRGREGVCGVDG